MVGAAKSKAPDANRLLAARFLSTLEIVEMNAVAAERFGTLKADLEVRGQRLADADLLIAAVTLAHDGVLATVNLRHYERIPDLAIEDWLVRT
jgi:tRNA(fMet)-specific endonuclease VapC